MFWRQEEFYGCDFKLTIEGFRSKSAQKAYAQIISNWSSLWGDALPMMEQEIVDYEYDKSVSELLENNNNTVNVLIMPPFEDEEYRLDIFIDIKFPQGSHVLGVEFIELQADEVTFTF